MKGQAALGILVLGLLVLGRRGLADTGNGTAAVDGEEDDAETFEEVEKNFKSFVGSVVKKILPILLEQGGDTEVSGPCKASIMKIIGGVRQLREWAMRFIDATGKVPPGILEGTSLSPGDYDECLAIAVGKRDAPPKTPEEVVFRGQYCLLESHRPEGINRAIKDYESGNKDSPIAKTKTFLNMFIRYKHLTNSTFKLGVCVPSKCTKRDLESILSSESLQSAGKITVNYCKQNEEEPKSAELIFLMILFGFIIGIMIVGTIIDFGLRISKKDKTKDTSIYIKYLEHVSRSTSLYTNAIEVLRTSTKESIRCLCGIRAIVVILTIYSHAYGHVHILHFQKFSKAANFLKFFDSFMFAGIANGSVAVDTIFLVSGITITYTRWRNITEKSKVNLNICKLLLQRYVRMSAAQLLVICFLLVLPLFGSGPFWIPYMESELRNCRSRWWLNILYVNNFFKTYQTCLYHTWVLAVIMQFTVMSCILMWILKRSFRLGLFTIIAIILSGIIGVGVVTFINKLPGSMAFFMLDVRTGPITWRDIFILPYDHMGALCIGLLAGYFLAVKKDTLDISRTTSVVLWCCSIACSCAVMFGLYSYRKGDTMDHSLSAFYAVMHRNVWALCIAWLIIACKTKHGGAVARVLHSGIFVPLDRLCYLAYLLQIPIMYYHSATLRERWFMGHFEILFLAVGYIALSFVGAFFLHIIFAQPYFAIEDCISSYFRLKKNVSFESRVNPVVKDPPGELGAINEIVSANGCVNVAYSKKLDGL